MLWGSGSNLGKLLSSDWERIKAKAGISQGAVIIFINEGKGERDTWLFCGLDNVHVFVSIKKITEPCLPWSISHRVLSDVDVLWTHLCPIECRKSSSQQWGKAFLFLMFSTLFIFNLIHSPQNLIFFGGQHERENHTTSALLLSYILDLIDCGVWR